MQAEVKQSRKQHYLLHLSQTFPPLTNQKTNHAAFPGTSEVKQTTHIKMYINPIDRFWSCLNKPITQIHCKSASFLFFCLFGHTPQLEGLFWSFCWLLPNMLSRPTDSKETPILILLHLSSLPESISGFSPLEFLKNCLFNWFLSLLFLCNESI